MAPTAFHLSEFTAHTLSYTGRIQVRMGGRIIATYAAQDFAYSGDPLRSALNAALNKRYAGDQGSVTELSARKGWAAYSCQTPA